MNGFQLTFYTVQQRVQDQRPIADWLIDEARALGIRGATAIAGAQGLGHDGGLHAATLFDQADQPVQVIMVVTAEEADQLFARLAPNSIDIFFVKTPVEFGFIGSGPAIT